MSFHSAYGLILNGECLVAVGKHWDSHPELPPIVEASGNTPRVGSVADLLVWAKSFERPRFTLVEDRSRRRGAIVLAFARGSDLRVAADDRGDLWRWIDHSQEITRITVAQLAAYVAAGSVEHAGELVAR